MEYFLHFKKVNHNIKICFSFPNYCYVGFGNRQEEQKNKLHSETCGGL